MTNEEYWFWLCNIDDIWNGKIRILLDAFSTPQNIYNSRTEQLELIPGIDDKDIDKIIKAKENKEILSEYEFILKKGIRFINAYDDEYPKKLKNITNRPYGIYVKGNLPPEDSKNLAIVGARACSSYGKEMTRKIAGELAKYGVGIISGMARGIDSASHEGALNAGGRTYAVLGSGLGNIYPRENIELYERIINSGGGVISEYSYNSPPAKWRFPQRNRLISGISDGVMVSEARERSGSLITVEYALEQGKDVFAIPGRICDELSSGCNRIIKSGAIQVNDPIDILREFGMEIGANENVKSKNIYGLEKEMDVVYSCLSLLPRSVYTIIEETDFTQGKVMSILVKLQLMGLVAEPVKSYYKRIETDIK